MMMVGYYVFDLAFDHALKLEKQAVIAATQDYFILKRIIVRKMFRKMLE